MLIMVKFSHQIGRSIFSTELFSDLIISSCMSANKCSYCILLFFPFSPPFRPFVALFFFSFFLIFDRSPPWAGYREGWA